MEYTEAKKYCEMLLICRKAIQKSIDAYKKRMAAQQVKMLKKLYTDFDPSGDKFLKTTRQEIPFVIVRWGKKDETFKVERPEMWIKTFIQALNIYKSVKGKEKYSWIVYIYSYRHDVATVARRYKVTRTSVYTELDQFRSILLLVAVQNHLLTIEKNQAPEGEEGLEGKA